MIPDSRRTLHLGSSDRFHGFAIVISYVGVPIRIVDYRHGYTRRGILDFSSLSPDSGQDAANGVEARVEFAARVVTDDSKLVIIAFISRTSDYDLFILHCYGASLAIANDRRHVAVIAETLVKIPVRVVAQTRKIIAPAAVVYGIASDYNFSIFLECHSGCVTADSADSS